MIGRTTSNILFFVIVVEAPKVTVTPQESRVKVGEPAEFTCIASGSPSPRLTWRKLNGSLRVTRKLQHGLLQIANVSQEDAGTYVCQAENIEGSAEGSAVLKIKGSVSYRHKDFRIPGH